MTTMQASDCRTCICPFILFRGTLCRWVIFRPACPEFDCLGRCTAEAYRNLTLRVLHLSHTGHCGICFVMLRPTLRFVLSNLCKKRLATTPQTSRACLIFSLSTLSPGTILLRLYIWQRCQILALDRDFLENIRRTPNHLTFLCIKV